MMFSPLGRGEKGGEGVILLFQEMQEFANQDFLGGPLVKAPHFNAAGQGSIPGLGTRSYMLCSVTKLKAFTNQCFIE